ncbi:MAG: YtxH domain-containing protein [Bacilli bacterium]|nr:YtxH domain-containing protein [Bacilli bacterium]
MKKMSNRSNKHGFAKFLAGVGIGAGLGLLFAPKSGEETRRSLKKKFDEFISEVKKIDVVEVKDEFLAKVEDIKSELEDLDKEKVLKIAKEKSEDIKKKTLDLVQLAKDKGTPVLEGVADDLRLKAIDVTKDVLRKLEK